MPLWRTSRTSYKRLVPAAIIRQCHLDYCGHINSPQHCSRAGKPPSVPCSSIYRSPTWPSCPPRQKDPFNLNLADPDSTVDQALQFCENSEGVDWARLTQVRALQALSTVRSREAIGWSAGLFPPSSNVLIITVYQNNAVEST